MIASLLLALLLQSNPAPAAPTKPGVVRGRITAADSGRPLRRAAIRLQSTNERSIRLTANTNGQGRFEIKDVPPGPYLVSVTRAGFLSLEYGQRVATERGLTVDVAAGATVDDIDLALPRAGVMAGRIVDEMGEPYPGVQVMALAMRYVDGQRMPTPAGGATTDDLGQFRIASAPPGTYTIVAISTETWRNDRQETFGYASTYYPGVSVNAAQRIVLGPSEQRLDLDFALHPSRTVRVSGRVEVEPGGRPATAAQLAYSFGSSILASGFRTARVAGDGSFEFADVTEGLYSVSAGGDDEMITVRDADISGITLASKVGSTVSGVFVGDDDNPPPFRPPGVRVSLLAPLGHVLPTVRVVSPEPDWSFKLQGLGGPFLFRAIGLPAGWSIGSVKMGDRDVTDTPWDVPTGGKQIDGLKIVLTQRAGRISGSVVDASNKPTSGATVIVFPDDDKLWLSGSRFISAQRPSRDGTFTIVGLPPGIYRAIARDVVEDGQWFDRAFLEGIRDLATRILVGDGAVAPVSLKLVTAR
jgi:hypothetical protein